MPFDEDEATRDTAHEREHGLPGPIGDSMPVRDEPAHNALAPNALTHNALTHNALAHEFEHDERAERESRAMLLPLRLDADRFEALAQRIEAAVASELLERAALHGRVEPSYRSLSIREGGHGRGHRGNTFASVLARAAWPALATAAAAALLAVGLTRNVGTRQTTSTDFVAGRMLAAGTTTRALPVGKPDATWIAQQTTPSTDDLAQAIGLGVEQ